MAGSFSLTPEVHVFPCPHCGETINTSVTQCSFCGTGVDSAAAEQSAADTAKISQAYSDASYLRVMLGLMLPFFGLIFVPLLSLLGVAGLWFLQIGLPIMCVRWWIKYGGIKTSDTDYAKARGNAMLVSCLIVVILVFLHWHIGRG